MFSLFIRCHLYWLALNANKSWYRWFDPIGFFLLSLSAVAHTQHMIQVFDWNVDKIKQGSITKNLHRNKNRESWFIGKIASFSFFLSSSIFYFGLFRRSRCSMSKWKIFCYIWTPFITYFKASKCVCVQAALCFLQIFLRIFSMKTGEKKNKNKSEQSVAADHNQSTGEPEPILMKT